MRVLYTVRAQGDLDEIYTYLDERNREAALSVKELLEERIRRLAAFPFMAPLTDTTGVHELALVEYPYKVYYEPHEDQILILHIRDTRREPWGGERRQ